MFTGRLNGKDEFGRLWKKVALICGAISEITWSNLIQDLSSPGRESNPGVLNTRKWR
jgi:hypothetical protein